MRIKRFTAPDMRTALRKVRDEQGPDAVILSTRTCSDGDIEVLAATDYDEALVAQALRAAAPALDEAPTRGRTAPMPAPAARVEVRAPVAEAAAPPAAVAGASRDSLMSRARAVFRIGDGPTLAELTAPAPSPAPMPMPAAASAHGASRFEAMMAALDAAPAMPPAAPAVPMPMPAPVAPAAPVSSSDAAPAPAAAAASPMDLAPMPMPMPAIVATPAAALPAPALPAAPALPFAGFPTPVAAAPDPQPMPAEAPAAPTPATASEPAAAPRPLQVVATPELDPAIAAMREEMSRMRQLMEAQMEQLSLERLRGSPARAAVLDALVGHGCSDALAREVAARIDPRLPVSEVQGPMFDELARMVAVVRNEPLEEGGVIALVGPTGAGKTTTAAKLAARFAARHRARDVALVTTDCERAGALEQLQALGRRLGITVCEAQGPERLQDTLAQLVDYPLVLVDTTGHAPRDRAVFNQVLWLRASRRVRSLLVLPANAHPHDLGEVVARYRPAKPEGVVLTKLDETGRPGSALSVLVRHGLGIAYTTHGQQVPSDLEVADADRLARSLEKSPRAADNPIAIEDRHAVA